MTLLTVEDLTVTIDTIHGPGHAVRNLSFELMPGNTLGIVGESGCGKSMTALSILGLLPDNVTTTGGIYFDHRNLLTCSDQELCQIRGNRISMIFQEPMTSLNPVHTIGQQIIEIMTLHQGTSKTEAKIEAIRLLDMVGIRDRGPDQSIPTPTFWWPTPAGDDCYCAFQQTRPPDCRRTDHSCGCHHTKTDPRTYSLAGK